MRTTPTIDDELLAKARELTGVKENAASVREALTALVRRESARRLIALGGSSPGIKPVPRRRPDIG